MSGAHCYCKNADMTLCQCVCNLLRVFCFGKHGLDADLIGHKKEMAAFQLLTATAYAQQMAWYLVVPPSFTFSSNLLLKGR